jgi:hypothetical protein
MLAKTVTEAARFVAEHGVIKEGAPTLAEFLLASPLRGADLELERQLDAPRDVNSTR